MKRWIGMICLMGLLCFSHTAYAGVISPYVQIKDPYLEKALREQLHVTEGPIRKEEAKKVTQLVLKDQGINTLDGIEFFPNLVYLDVSFNNVQEATPIAHLSSLTTLKLNGNQIEDISFLQTLSKLEHLEMNSNGVSNLASLKNLQEMRILLLNHNHIQQIDALEKLKRLEKVDVRYNNIQSIQPLHKQKYLHQSLLLKGNPVKDYTPVFAYYKEIKEVDFKMNGITEKEIFYNVSVIDGILVIYLAGVLGVCIYWFFKKNSFAEKEPDHFLMWLILLTIVCSLVSLTAYENLVIAVSMLTVFALLRNQQTQLSLKESAYSLQAAVIGILVGMQHFTLGILLVFLINAAVWLCNLLVGSKKAKKAEKLIIHLPEFMDYELLLNDLFERFADKHELVSVQKSEDGSFLVLCYYIRLKEAEDKTQFMNLVRERNGHQRVSLFR